MENNVRKRKAIKNRLRLGPGSGCVPETNPIAHLGCLPFHGSTARKGSQAYEM